MNIQIVTDSTIDIPVNLLEELDIKIVPIYIHFGDKTYRDGVDISKDTFYKMLIDSPVHPATSQPNPEDFTKVYQESMDNKNGIVSIHISSKISGTFNAAAVAGKTLGEKYPIEIIDSGFNSAGLGLVVLAAARKAQSGAGFPEVVQEARQAIRQVKMLGMFATMKYLARGGRINKTIAAASHILHVMPLLTFNDGEIVRAGLVRRMENGIEKIITFVRANLPIEEMIIVHSAAENHAIALKDRLFEFVESEKISIAELGAGLGVHGGPGVVLVALRRSDSHAE